MRKDWPQRTHVAIVMAALLGAAGAGAATPSEDLASAAPVMDRVDDDWLVIRNMAF